MAPLPGYRYLGKKQGERYEAPDGSTLSKRQYRNVQLQAEGWDSLAEKERTSRSPQYRKWLEDYSEAQGISPKDAASHSSEFNSLYVEAKQQGFPRDKDGPFARLLTAMGYRTPQADYNVGDTP